MNRKSVLIMLLLLIAMLAAVWGLPLMAQHMKVSRENSSVYITVIQESEAGSGESY